MNPKSKGEKGQRIVIGELAKWDIDVAIPLTDNLPWDFIVVYNNKLFRAQVKSSSQVPRESNGSIVFDLTTSNWYQGTTKKYSSNDIDIIILCDFQNVYLLSQKDFLGRRAFTIRKTASKNNQKKNMNFHEDFILSKERLDMVFV